MVELQVVVLAVAGSSPVGHPIFPTPQTGRYSAASISVIAGVLWAIRWRIS